MDDIHAQLERFAACPDSGRLRSAFARQLRAHRLPEHLAEDVLQETYRLALASKSPWRGDSSFYTWLLHIGCNAVRTEKRQREARSRRDRRGFNDWARRRAPEPPPEIAETIERAVEQLEPPLRSVAEAKLRGGTEEDVALELSIPVGTVKTRWMRARNRIRAKLQKHRREGLFEQRSPKVPARELFRDQKERTAR